MNFKKSLKRNKDKSAQMLLEYTLLVGIAILAIIVVNIISGLRANNTFEDHFIFLAGPAGGLLNP